MSNSAWEPGQRVVNEAEPGLGLGRVVRIIDHRNVEIYFGAAQTTRIYNVRTAPLRRLILKKGQEAVAQDGSRLRIERILRKGSLFIYLGHGKRVAEQDLADVLPSSDVVDRLLQGQLGRFIDYDLRRDGWKLRQTILSERVRGLVGARVRLIPHQLYIAHTVARRETPRVLLADEVGLGKTIEAGLIFSALRVLGRAERVLVLVPESLTLQWLAEMYRKFNVMFTVLDAERCLDKDESPHGPSPFQSSSYAICNYEFLARDERRLLQAEEVVWDLIIVDEAHHLVSHPQESPEYAAVRRLSQRSNGLLLLTATPQRDGLITEFSLLRLVDPDRFADLDTFLEEQSHMRRVARLAAHLTDDAKPQRAKVLRELTDAFPQDEALHRLLGSATEAREVLQALVDRHGTGRVLIRNRRDRLHGFPGRNLHAVALELPDPWHNILGDVDAAAMEEGDLETLLASVAYLPSARRQAARHDPRMAWLVRFLRTHARDKVVLICSRPRTVLQLQQYLREHTRIAVAAFHEQLSVVERDRQVAYFADAEGAQLLLCSEIGGEGRNLQFSHHLVLYDLPLHPDLLEQRIGRLDRIGQGERVHVHALYLKDSPSEALFQWHRHGLRSFERHVSGAEQVVNAIHSTLLDTLRHFMPSHAQFSARGQRLQDLLHLTRQTLQEVRKKVHESVDYLVDLNSNDERLGAQLIEEIEGIDADDGLAAYLGRVFDRWGVSDEELDANGRRRIRPSDMMFVDSFPGLGGEDGIGATYRRDLALTREDLDFLSHDHPLVEGALALTLDQEEGGASVCLWPQAPWRGILVCFLFVIEASGPAALELSRYLPVTPVEICLDLQGNVRDERPQRGLEKAPPESVAQLRPMLAEQVPQLQRRAEELADSQLQRVRQQALSEADVLRQEHERLIELRKINPTLPTKEIQSHADKLRATLSALREARVRLDAVRLILLQAAAERPPESTP